MSGIHTNETQQGREMKVITKCNGCREGEHEDEETRRDSER